MESKAKALILGCHMDMVTMEEALAAIKELVDNRVPSQVVTLNAEMVFTAQSNDKLKQIINTASLVTPDGIGVVWGARRFGYRVAERVTGVDLVGGICQMAVDQGWGVYLLGGAPGVADAAAQNLVKMYPGLQISGSHHGYFSEKEQGEITQEIRVQQPQILFVGLGAPKQEFWIKEHLNKLNVPVCLGVGGSFDVIGGIKKRAPGFFIKLNLEWLYRLVSEPSRFRRQLVLPRFALLVLKEKFFPSS